MRIDFSRRHFLLSMTALACSKKRSTATQQRIVSLSPSTTESIAAMGALSLLVGRSRYCDFPPEVTALPEVGGYVDPNFEAIVALAPSLVVGARGPAGASIVDKLSQRGIDTYFPETESFAHIDEMILGLGARTHRDEMAAEITAKIHAQRDAIDHAIGSSPKVRAILLFGITPIVAAGKNTFADEMLSHAGAENVIAAAGYPTLDIEALVLAAPDRILNAAMAETRGASIISNDAPGWRDVSAVKRGNVTLLNDETVLRPGPRVADGLATLARALHPEISISDY